MKPPSVSVALATYNGERFLLKQLKSIAEQTLLPNELIACDDISTDSTLNILIEFQKTAPFNVIIIVNENRLNYADNFLKAAFQCPSEYIAFCDQDDIWLKSKLERLVEEMQSTNAYLVAHRSILIDQYDQIVASPRRFSKKVIISVNNLDPWDCFAGHACLIRRDLLSLAPSESRPVDLISPHYKSAHDRWIYFLSSLVGQATVLPDQLIYYRQHSNNVYGSRRHSLATRIAKIKSKYYEYLLIRLKIATTNLAIIDDLLVSGSTGDANATRLARTLWARICNEYRCRVKIFENHGIGMRTRQLIRAVQAGAYINLPGKSAVRALAEDIMAIFIAQPLLDGNAIDVN
jgi:glycosyltransferase involved in cell wall biosynthesis